MNIKLFVPDPINPHPRQPWASKLFISGFYDSRQPFSGEVLPGSHFTFTAAHVWSCYIAATIKPEPEKCMFHWLKIRSGDCSIKFPRGLPVPTPGTRQPPEKITWWKSQDHWLGGVGKTGIQSLRQPKERSISSSSSIFGGIGYNIYGQEFLRQN